MSRRHLLAAVLLVSLLNGLASPAVLFVMVLAPVWMPEFVTITMGTVAYGASLIVAFATTLLAGVPAALWERLRGQRDSDSTSMLVWLAGAVLLSLPALGRFL
jgi:hypothetical protein